MQQIVKRETTAAMKLMLRLVKFQDVQLYTFCL